MRNEEHKQRGSIYISSALEREYRIEYWVKWDHDSHYGEDADGNRGIDVWSLDETEIELIESVNTGNKIPVGLLSDDYYNQIIEKIIDEV